MAAPLLETPPSALDRAAAQLHARFGAPELRVGVEASGLREQLRVPAAELRGVVLPLLLALAAACGGAPRAVAGIAGSAGSGKSTLASLLAELGNALAEADAAELVTASAGADAAASAAAPFPAVASISMDGYHLTNAEMEARGLRSRKGVVETIHGTALAGDLELLLGPSPLAPRAQAPPSAAEPLGARASWAVVDVDGTARLPAYDRAVTHEPVLGAAPVPPRARLVLVEGLFVARGDGRGVVAEESGPPGPPGPPGAPAPESSVVGPDAAAWPRVLAAQRATVLLAAPLLLCRARCLQRRLRAALARGEDAAARAAKLRATDQHYARNDAPTWRAVTVGDRRRATLVVELPLPPALAAALAAAGGDALAVPAEAAVAALEEDEAAAARAGAGGFAGASVVVQARA